MTLIKISNWRVNVVISQVFFFSISKGNGNQRPFLGLEFDKVMGRITSD